MGRIVGLTFVEKKKASKKPPTQEQKTPETESVDAPETPDAGEDAEVKEGEQ